MRNLAGPQLLRAFADAYPHAFFVEIGSNDGEQHDHLRPFILSRPWRGIMVEPVPYVFERLRRNYESQGRIELENVAVAEEDGQLPFYYLVEPTQEERETLPDWYDGIGSFSRDAVVGHAAHIPDIESRIVSSEVTALTFESLCRRNRVERVDLLLIDTEGHDWQILQQHRPRPAATAARDLRALPPVARAIARPPGNTWHATATRRWRRASTASASTSPSRTR